MILDEVAGLLVRHLRLRVAWSLGVRPAHSGVGSFQKILVPIVVQIRQDLFGVRAVLKLKFFVNFERRQAGQNFQPLPGVLEQAVEGRDRFVELLHVFRQRIALVDGQNFPDDGVVFDEGNGAQDLHLDDGAQIVNGRSYLANLDRAGRVFCHAGLRKDSEVPEEAVVGKVVGHELDFSGLVLLLHDRVQLFG